MTHPLVSTRPRCLFAAMPGLRMLGYNWEYNKVQYHHTCGGKTISFFCTVLQSKYSTESTFGLAEMTPLSQLLSSSSSSFLLLLLLLLLLLFLLLLLQSHFLWGGVGGLDSESTSWHCWRHCYTPDIGPKGHYITHRKSRKSPFCDNLAHTRAQTDRDRQTYRSRLRSSQSIFAFRLLEQISDSPSRLFLLCLLGPTNYSICGFVKFRLEYHCTTMCPWKKGHLCNVRYSIFGIRGKRQISLQPINTSGNPLETLFLSAARTQ